MLRQALHFHQDISIIKNMLILIKNITKSLIQFRYVTFSFHQVNDRLHDLYSNLFEDNAEYRRNNRFILVCQRITEAEERKQYTWIIK